ncbi:MAG: helix-turn-helix domain-containing protein [Flavobacteriaceae bacterium]|nr:helix-turn-helix domain-containing protein [Flavobacteriaceae bacterium]
MSLLLPLKFPNFNMYSTPLLVLVLQGLIFAFLLLWRYRQKKTISDLLLALILLITCYHRTTYTIGFMDWYDTFRNTKINYYLISLGMVLAPLIYFYVKSITTSEFRFLKRDFWHFVPWLIFFVAKSVILIYDMNQPGFYDTQNGYLVVNFQWKYLDPIVTVVSSMQMLLYLAFTFQLFYNYRGKIQNYFSNTYKLELNWIRNFLFLYSFIFVYGLFQIFINEVVTELSWIQKWWLQFFSALIVLYVGIKGYFTDTVKLTALNFESDDTLATLKIEKSSNVPERLRSKKEELQEYFEREKPYLNPDLNLVELAKKLNMNRAELSEVINLGFGQNFNDFVNQYRVEAVKQMFSENKQKELSLLGIAFDCGFNSKATFNRVFKKLTSSSPSEYLKTIS